MISALLILSCVFINTKSMYTGFYKKRVKCVECVKKNSKGSQILSALESKDEKNVLSVFKNLYPNEDVQELKNINNFLRNKMECPECNRWYCCEPTANFRSNNPNMNFKANVHASKHKLTCDALPARRWSQIILENGFDFTMVQKVISTPSCKERKDLDEIVQALRNGTSVNKQNSLWFWLTTNYPSSAEKLKRSVLNNACNNKTTTFNKTTTPSSPMKTIRSPMKTIRSPMKTIKNFDLYNNISRRKISNEYMEETSNIHIPNTVRGSATCASFRKFDEIKKPQKQVTSIFSENQNYNNSPKIVKDIKKLQERNTHLKELLKKEEDHLEQNRNSTLRRSLFQNYKK